MSENQYQPIQYSSMLSEIQERLRESQQKKKEEIEKKLEEKIKKEQEAAQKKLEKIDQEITEEDKVLSSYQVFLNNFESEKVKIKEQIQAFINEAAADQDEIKKITLNALEKIKPVNELNLQLKELNGAIEEKIQSMQKDFEEKLGMSVQIPENGYDEEPGENVEDAIKRLEEIIKLLEAQNTEEKAPDAENDTSEIMEKEEKEDENLSDHQEQGEEDKSVSSPISTFMEILEKHRKYEGSNNEEAASFFENGIRKVIDGEYIVSEITGIIEEAEKFHNKHFDFESPREQLFAKQKMINYQDELRKLMLNVNRVCDKNSCSFPKFTQDILNFDIFKDLYNKVTIQNWSNDQDFSTFVESIKNLRDDFLGRITPPHEYLKSIIQELDIKV